MTKKEKLLIDLINFDDVSKREIQVALYCDKTRTQQEIISKFGLPQSNISRILKHLVANNILIQEHKGLKYYTLNKNWECPHEQNQMTLDLK